MQRGVFVKSKRSPILTMDNSIEGPYSPSLRGFVDSGRLFSEPVQSLAVINQGWHDEPTAPSLNPEKTRNV
jgi:hypothetical protein